MVGFTRPPCDAGVIHATTCFDRALSQRCKWLTLAATIVGSSMAFLDGSVVNIALPAIQQALHSDAAATQWIVNAYMLLLGALVLIGGSAADLYGRRRIFVLGVTVFTAASVACGLSPNIAALTVSRAVQGFGAALLTPASLAMLGATFDEHERSQAIGIWAGAGALMLAAGPPLGGWLVDQVSWRAIFLLNVPLAIAAAGLALRFACESSDPHAKQLDWSGAVTVAIGLATITWGLSAIPTAGFRDKTVLAALGVGTAFLVLFVAIEARLHEWAMMPLSLYRSRNFSATNALTLLLYFALGGALYYLPFGLIRLGGYSATQAGAALLPFALIMGFGASFAGTLTDRLGPRSLLTMGPIIAACGLAMLAVVDLRQPFWVGVFPSIFLLGIGMSITVPPLTSTVMAAAGNVHAGIASGVNNAVARIAGLLAVAALGATLFASFSYHLVGPTPPQANEALNAVMSGQSGIHEKVVAAFECALRTIMLVTASCSALAGLVGWLWTEPNGTATSGIARQHS
ncbi:drug resistance transporter, EmrB/QacA subfamily [Bradyrhizobium sp. Rc2d]|uniref:MFS transporter n=1 Tax=Bradyrhizobium sp. Rc2d TaxID=1855321 RepID=UPI0008896DEC|nr:MFS transporter [Bradyrhizobium sp. Rc2d]SDI58292.1 drug resistance transporter, EmrB/QacA subfamily [Bradyrhizobium sp. Rc2d]